MDTSLWTMNFQAYHKEIENKSNVVLISHYNFKINFLLIPPSNFSVEKLQLGHILCLGHIFWSRCSCDVSYASNCLLVGGYACYWSDKYWILFKVGTILSANRRITISGCSRETRKGNVLVHLEQRKWSLFFFHQKTKFTQSLQGLFLQHIGKKRRNLDAVLEKFLRAISIMRMVTVAFRSKLLLGYR